jgi:hypothetical protein
MRRQVAVESGIERPACSATKETGTDNACRRSRDDDCGERRSPEGPSRHHSTGTPRPRCSHLRKRLSPRPWLPPDCENRPMWRDDPFSGSSLMEEFQAALRDGGFFSRFHPGMSDTRFNSRSELMALVSDWRSLALAV